MQDSDLCYSAGGYSYGELDRGYDATATNNVDGMASRILFCKWTDHVNFVNYLLTANNGSSGVFGTFIVGATHPNYSNMFVDNVHISPFGKPTGQAAYQYAELQVNYKQRQFSAGSPAVIREDTVGLSGVIVPLLKESIKFADDTKIDRDAELVVPWISYKVTFKGVSTIPLSAIIAAYGRSNTSSFTLRLGGQSVSVGAQFAVFNGIDDVRINYTAVGAQHFDITYNVLVSPINVNFEYNPNNTATDAYGRYEAATPTKYPPVSWSGLGI